MTRRTIWVVALLSLVVATVAPGAVDAGERRTTLTYKQILGTWIAEFMIPPNPLVGNSQDLIMLEYVTFSRNGGIVATANFPYFPVPIDGKLKTAIVSVGHSSWRRHGELVRGTNWRFLNSKKNGTFLGFLKGRIEIQLVAPDKLEGRYVLELLNPDLSPMRLGGAAVVLGPSEVRAFRVPVEAIE